MDEFDVAEWYAMVEKAVEWLLAHPTKGSWHALTAIRETPAEHAFIEALLASPNQQDRLIFEIGVQRAVAIHRGELRSGRRRRWL